MFVLAFDPGETTGFVLVHVSSAEVANSVNYSIHGARAPVIIKQAGTFRGLGELSQKLGLFQQSDVVVIEDYIVYPNRAQSHIGDRVLTARMIGAIEWICYYHHGRTQNMGVVFQMASQAKQQWPNERIQSCFGTIHPPRMDSTHELDALRHALTYIENYFGDRCRLVVRQE